MKLGAGLASLMWASFANGAQAQSAAPSEWQVLRTANMTAAAAQFDNGLTLIVRCNGGRHLNAMIQGLPPAEGHTRHIGATFESGEAAPGLESAQGARHPTIWGVGHDPGMAFSRYPAGLARQMLAGGSLSLHLVGETDENARYKMALPGSAGPVETVLTSCGRTVADARDAGVAALGPEGLPPRISWARLPALDYPSGPTQSRGAVTASCLTRPDGRVEQCIIESEQPEGAGFGQATLRGLRSARLRNEDNEREPVPRRVILFTASFSSN